MQRIHPERLKSAKNLPSEGKNCKEFIAKGKKNAELTLKERKI